MPAAERAVDLPLEVPLVQQREDVVSAAHADEKHPRAGKSKLFVFLLRVFSIVFLFNVFSLVFLLSVFSLVFFI